MAATYDRIGREYANKRQPDPRIAAVIRRVIGDAATVVDVGAGTGSYEPAGITVLAVEPSAVMISQRPAGSAPAVRAAAEALPLPDKAVDVATALLAHHHWTDPERGFAELRRVSRRQVVFTWDPSLTQRFWFARDYLPEASQREHGLAALDAAVTALGPDVTVIPVPVPHDCTDGFYAAYWRRPHAYLDPAVRAAISGLALLDQRLVDRAVRRLAADLASGTWSRRYAHLTNLADLDAGYRLVVAGE